MNQIDIFKAFCSSTIFCFTFVMSKKIINAILFARKYVNGCLQSESIQSKLNDCYIFEPHLSFTLLDD